MKRSIATVATATLLICAGAFRPQRSPTAGFVPPPPGSVAQNERVAFSGNGNIEWRAIVSKERVGASNNRGFYQWFLSFYMLERGTYQLRYQSPRNGGPLSRVTQANGAQMWFPVAQARIVGTASLMQAGVHQLVVQSHEMAADCGSGAVTIFATQLRRNIAAVATVENPCDLSATIGAAGTSIELKGPYYASGAPLCCPTKAHATAELRYRDGAWALSPKYFKVIVK
ncbi:MAG: hypothetical protein WBV40_00470 [Candidatus Cybelea sp.]